MDNAGDDPILQLALALSMQDEEGVGAQPDNGESGQSDKMDTDETVDAELQKALALSMEETTVKDDDDDDQAPKRRKDNESSSSIPKISPQEIASSLTEVLKRSQDSSGAGPSGTPSTIDADLVASIARSLASGTSQGQHAPQGTQQIAKNLDNPVPHSWVNHAVSWNPPSDLQDSQVLLAIERCRPEIMKFLDSLLGKRIDVRGTFTVESAASAVVAAAMGRKIAGQIQKLSELQAKCRAYLSSSSDPAEMEHFIHGFEIQLARKALDMLKKDEDDIFFDGGQVKAEVQGGLSNGSISCSFMDLVAASCRTPDDVKACEDLLTMSFRMIQCDLTDDGTLGSHLHRLDLLTQSSNFIHMLSSLLIKEVTVLENKSSTNREAFEKSSIFQQLLSVSTVVEAKEFKGRITSPMQPVLTAIRGYPTNKGQIEASQAYVRKILEEAHSAAFEIMKRLVKYKHPQVPLMGRESVLTWLSAVATLGSSRTKGGERQALKKSAKTLSDGFTLGALSAALRFCRPFLKGEEKFLQRLDPHFYWTQLHRFGGRLKDQALSGDRKEFKSLRGNKWFPPDRSSSEAPHFVPEVFFLTQRLINTALIPAINRYANIHEALHRLSGSGKGPQKPTVEGSVLRDSAVTQLLDPVFAGDVVKFMALQAMWLRHLILNKDYNAFNAIPDHVVRNIGSWLIFVIHQGSALLLGDIDIGHLMESLVLFVEQQNLIKSPLVLSKIVELILAMLSPQLHAQGRAKLGPVISRPGEAALVAAVLGTRAAQERLVPALLHLYSEADHVVGLDVDRDAFDKFSMRNCIDLILEEMWKDEICKASLVNAAKQTVTQTNEEGVFGKYIGSLLNDLMYLLKDCFDRLADIHNIEESMEDTSGWSKLEAAERDRKVEFYEGQQRTCKGFMRLSVTTLRLLNLLTEDKVVVRAFLIQPFSGRAAYGVLRFLELLVGPGCSNISVKKPEQYYFNHDQLLGGVCDFMLQLGLHSEFQEVLAEEPDFDAIGCKVFKQAKERLVSSHQFALSTGLDALMVNIESLKSQKQSGVGQNAGMAGEDQYSFSEPEAAHLDEQYVNIIQPLAVKEFDASLPMAYNSSYNRYAEESGDMNPKGMKRLGRELRDLKVKSLLPIYPASSIVIRHDSERIDKVRALITGPEGTPYGYGCFVFDILFPPDYPNVPPLMHLETTGQGRARFNPNLYADGKVCLSLLGTWHGSEAYEKWNPAQSTLFQILVSIQGMIFVEDPYFNEPNVDLMRNTVEGSTASKSYNAELHLNTVRWAMIDQLKNPREGFQEVTQQHFKLMRHRIMKQCERWIEECTEGQAALKDRLAASVAELHHLLMVL